jgi:nitrate reductase NapE
MNSENPGQRRKEEFRSWLFLTAIMAPVLAVLFVSGYGFVVWMLQLI